MQPRTKRQKEVLEYIKHHIESHGYEPSYQQIARHLGVSSKAGIAKHVEALENQGLISRTRENGSFKLEINSTKSVLEYIHEIGWLEIPEKIEFDDDWENNRLFVPALLIDGHAGENIKALRVRDDSLLDDHICEGDIALIEHRTYPRDGETVAAILDGKSTVVMNYFRAGSNIELRPSNRDVEPIVISADKIEIVGVLRAILRQTR